MKNTESRDSQSSGGAGQSRLTSGTVPGSKVPEGSQPGGTEYQADVVYDGQFCVRAEMNMEQVVCKENMTKAYRRVVSNKGSSGVDGMRVEDLQEYLRSNWERIRKELLEDRYTPEAVLKVEIPKPGGKGMRMLGIPTVLDRLIQQALLQVMQGYFEEGFSEYSYGFIRGRSTHDALKKAQEHVREGHRWVVDLDLEKFFDRVNHDILMSRLHCHIEDKRILHLIRRYLKAGIMSDGLISVRMEGTPQGGPLSPLLSNILLDELDKELEQRGHRFVRYADDCNVYVQSKEAGIRVLGSLERFLEKRLRLKVNREKSAVERPWKRKFLGYSFTMHKLAKLKVAPESIKRLKGTLREIFRQGRGRSLKNTIELINLKLKGWSNYYRLNEVKVHMDELDEWLRRRMRVILWRQWKKPKRRYAQLLRRGIDPDRAKKNVSNGRGPWWNAGSDHMNHAFTKDYFYKCGLISLLDEHIRWSHSSGTAGYGTVRPVVWEDGP